MKKAIKGEEKSGGPAEWLVTYSDMMTVLFVMFVMFFSMSTINPVQWDLLVQAFGARQRTVVAQEIWDMQGDGQQYDINAWLVEMIEEWDLAQDFSENVGEEGEAGEAQQEAQERDEFDHIFQLVTMYVAQEGLADQILVERADNYVMIRFGDRVLFPSGRADINYEGREVILFIGAAIGLITDMVDTIRIEGHTDNVPIRTMVFADNWALGSARANAIVRLFEEVGLPPGIMRPVSMGEHSPIADNETPEGRALNRRVEIYITRAGAADAETDLVIADAG